MAVAHAGAESARWVRDRRIGDDVDVLKEIRPFSSAAPLPRARFGMVPARFAAWPHRATAIKACVSAEHDRCAHLQASPPQSTLSRRYSQLNRIDAASFNSSNTPRQALGRKTGKLSICGYIAKAFTPAWRASGSWFSIPCSISSNGNVIR